jgi:hypothetical protein
MLHGTTSPHARQQSTESNSVGRYGQLMAVKKFDAASDEDALRIARQIGPGDDLEVWTGDRKVDVI